jgi:hypothetical protein
VYAEAEELMRRRYCATARAQAHHLLLGLAVLCLLLPQTILADGSLPPNPYNYLHPPAALNSGNKHPLSLNQVYNLAAIQSGEVSGFTPDGQAGLSFDRQSVHGVKQARITISPVNTPPGLPSSVAADGNAYVVTATGKPGGNPLSFSTPAIVTLRFPHIPVGMYFYGAGWKEICKNTGGAIITSTTITCQVSRLGLFVAATNPSNVGTGPAPPGPNNGLRPYIPILAALILILAVIYLGYRATRQERKG